MLANASQYYKRGSKITFPGSKQQAITHSAQWRENSIFFFTAYFL